MKTRRQFFRQAGAAGATLALAELASGQSAGSANSNAPLALVRPSAIPSAYVDATGYLRRDHNSHIGQGTDDSPGLSAALADMARAGLQRLYLPRGYIQLRSAVLWPRGMRGINLEFLGEGPAAGDMYQWNQPNCTILFCIGGVVPFDIRGAIGCRFRGITFVGLARAPQRELPAASGAAQPAVPSNPLPPAFIRLTDAGGCTGNRIEYCSFAHGQIGVQLGAKPAEINCDQSTLLECHFSGLGACFASSNDQAVLNSMEHCQAYQCPTIARIDAGGNLGINIFSATACGSACPAIPARPKPDPQNDWMVLLGRGGPNNPQVSIRRLHAEATGGQPASGQLVRVLDGYRTIVVEDLEQVMPGSAQPLYHIRNSSALVFRGGNVMSHGPILGTSDDSCPVLFDATRFWMPPGKAVGQAPIFRDCTVQGAGKWERLERL